MRTRRWIPLRCAGRSLLFACAAASLALLPSRLLAQSDSARQVSALLLRALAEAADGYRTGEPVWIVASYAGPPFVVGVYATRDSAARVVRDSGASYGVFGPYVTPMDRAVAPTSPALVGVTLTFRMPDGQRVSVPLNLDKVDALFLNLSAVDKFAVPYYARLYGPTYASRVKDLMVSGGDGGCHWNITYPCSLADLLAAGRRGP